MGTGGRAVAIVAVAHGLLCDPHTCTDVLALLLPLNPTHTRSRSQAHARPCPELHSLLQPELGL